MNNIINIIENKYINKNIPLFRTGDYIEVKINIKEGKKKRVQNFEGVVIAIRNRGINSSFTVRKISHGEGVERVFETFSNIIRKISIKKHGIVNKSKLYYIRNRTGRSSRIKTKLR
ncbi:MAG: 50S ribosomal protein L19 [Candidatus Makana argininalis]